ncbi:MAG: SUMF1/EgtB/PvdO family nonheme iron enzyme [Melioribacteraceae bacterium]|nr:SUMF1/EgtB/PvdO family nonheme iron enzyme [Melioribacteraceae bacterium]MCF8354159.1 SUMF1/EgtB/PvdO family nonheme iron enzyme [Melioribacteraceae bacterium]MCF8396027.1 SUMF1/EgtB/PvdO family nonheme iron enzyme [Melioribacteraceae bacterium]MCF8418082.1 SUMF1/EgtB/PvdO family nonheme iron enzyme [Melioribacteraceae bacterium]
MSDILSNWEAIGAIIGIIAIIGAVINWLIQQRSSASIKKELQLIDRTFYKYLSAPDECFHELLLQRMKLSKKLKEERVDPQIFTTLEQRINSYISQLTFREIKSKYNLNDSFKQNLLNALADGQISVEEMFVLKNEIQKNEHLQENEKIQLMKDLEKFQSEAVERMPDSVGNGSIDENPKKKNILSIALLGGGILIVLVFVGLMMFEEGEEVSKADEETAVVETQDLEAITNESEEPIAVNSEAPAEIEEAENENTVPVEETKTTEAEPESVKAVKPVVETPKEEKPKLPMYDEMIYVQGGTFSMGSDIGSNDEKPVHTISVSGFSIRKYEVSQREWKTVMGSRISAAAGFISEDYPAINVSWYDAVKFCNKKSQSEGLSPCYTISGTNVTCDFSKNGYRLPTEAEWEYAATGGKKNQGFKFSGADDLKSVGWTKKDALSNVMELGKKGPNQSGIFDMSGNAAEWCWDWFKRGYYSTAEGSDPKGPESGSYKIVRGGSWKDDAYDCRTTYREWESPTFKENTIGFRMVRR